MTIQQLHYLLEVYHAGSISQAARNLYVAQSSISNSISYLEKELGFLIFHRSRAGVVPTVQGQVVLEQASRLCESYRRMSDTQQSVSRNIRISSSPYLPVRNAFIRLSLENQDREDITLFYLSYPLPARAERQYGFRSIPLGNLEYRLITVSNPIHAAAPEIQRFLTLLEEEVSQV